MTTLNLGQGRRLAYWDTGSGRPLVFIHGMGTPGALWQHDLADLAADCRVLVHDRRGYGASSPSPRDWRAHADDAIALVEALDAAPAVLVGYSGGSIVALDLIERRPELVSGLVLLDPAFNLKRCVTPGAVRALVTAHVLRRVAGKRRGAEHWMRYVSSRSTGGSAFESAPPERRERLLDDADGIFADMASANRGEQVAEARLREIAVPVTLIEAKLSPPLLRRSCARLKQLLPQARVVCLEGSGHHVGLDAREELLDALRDAVREGAPAPAGDAR